MPDETVPVLPSTSDAQPPTDNVNFQDIFSQFLKTGEENQLRHQVELSEGDALFAKLKTETVLW